MHKVVQNSTLDGIMAIVFALLVLVVLADAVRVCIRAVRTRVPIPTTEADYVASRFVAPGGLLATAEERRLLADAAQAAVAPQPEPVTPPLRR